MTTQSVPSEWELRTVGEAGDARLGKRHSRQWRTGPNMRPCLGVANVLEDRIDLTDVMSMPFTPSEAERFQLAPGDILLNEGQSPDLVGRPAIYRGEMPGVCFTNSLIRFRPGPGVLPEWALLVFRHLMRSGRFRQEARVSANIAHLPLGRLKSVEFPVPPLNQQECLVAEADRRLSQVELSLRSLRPAKSRLTAAKHAALATGSTGGLVPPQQGDEEIDTFLEKVLGDVDAPKAPLDVEGLPSIPAHWRWVPLGQLAEVTGGVIKDTKREADPTYRRVPYLRVANVQRGRLALADIGTIRVPAQRAADLALIPGDVLFVAGGDRDKLGRGWVWEGQLPNCIHQNHVLRARLRPGVLRPRLLSWFGNSAASAWFDKRSKQTTILSSINLTTLKALPVPVPPPAEQAAIEAELDRYLSFLQAATEELGRAEREARLLVSAILCEAAQGRLGMSPQRPTTKHVL